MPWQNVTLEKIAPEVLSTPVFVFANLVRKSTHIILVIPGSECSYSIISGLQLSICLPFRFDPRTIS